MRVQDLESIKIKLASPEEILKWSHGEVTKPETINYRTQRFEKDGLFCERIFGPEKDYECYCGKYKRIRYKGVVCEKCGVEVTKSSVRRERMGHIKLACPVSHIWFLRGIPSIAGLILDVSMQSLEKVVYFASYIITKVDEEAKKKVLERIDKEYEAKLKAQNMPRTVRLGGGGSGSELKVKNDTKKKKEKKKELQELKAARNKIREEVLNIQPLKILSELEYHDLSLKYGEIFEAGTGAETLRKIFEEIDLSQKIKELREEIAKASSSKGRKAHSSKRLLRRLRVFQTMAEANIRPEWMFLTVLPVIPPDLRPMVQLDGGRFASSDLNDLYRRVINRNNRLKYLLEINAPEVIIRNEKRMLQEAVDALIDNGMRKGQLVTTASTGGKRVLKSLADLLKGKQGRFRQNLLGKRVDYSGRSVIVVGPELKLHQCGIPKRMALELFKPFVIKKILDKELAYNVRSASRLIEQKTDEVWAILEEVVKNKCVLLNRAPTLHRLGIQAFYPVLIEGEAIRLHPLVCHAFNADFDGDQMAIHLPLLEQAQKEAREIMLSSLNLLLPATGAPVVSPTQDIVLGCYYLTRIKEGVKGEGKIFSSAEEAKLAYEFGEVDLRAKIKVPYQGNKDDKSEKIDKLMETSVGRIIFNEVFPSDYPFQNREMDSKQLKRLTSEIIERYGIEKVEPILDKIKELGFEYATLSGITWGMDDLVVPKEKPKLIKAAEKEIETINRYYKKGLLSKRERKSKVIEVWHGVKLEIEKLVPETLPSFGPVSYMMRSGARGSWSQPVQMSGMKGLVSNPLGQTIELPIKSSYKEGFDVLEYFISTHGARKGTVDTALRTSTAGYLTRRLIDVAHEVIVSEEDCGDKKGIKVSRKEAQEIGQSFLLKIVGRVVLEDVKYQNKDGNKKEEEIIVRKGEIIDWEKANRINELGIEQIQVRSPISCKSARGVCQKCYGWDLGNNKLVKQGEAVGITAAQSIGEPGVQLTLRTFHTGGVAGGGDITYGLPRVQEIFEKRSPKRKAVIAKKGGRVIEITPDRVIRIKPQAQKNKKENIMEYKVLPNQAIWVKPGEEVQKGQQLCEGSLDLDEVFKIRGARETQRYIIQEIQKIYAGRGAFIHDKHIEVIARQMFSRVKIIDRGDSHFSEGEIVEKAEVIEENIRLEKQKKKLIESQPIFLGISRVALTTDSFLSAASFQETSRILIKAAIEGKKDKLRGLKENVVIGKLIPAGTGFRK